MREKLDGIEVFVEAVEAGGFSRAASKLALSRSAVGKTITRLEARLGVRLFHRTTRAQSLTEDGHIYYERCLRALAELRAGASLIQSGRHEIIGKLKISMPVLLGRHCAAPILVNIAKEHPGLELDLSFSDLPVDLIAEGVDLAVRIGALGQGSGLVTRKLATQHKILCASPVYLADRDVPEQVDDLIEHDAIVYLRNGHTHAWILPAPAGGYVEASPRSRLRFDNHEAIVDAAVASMGIAWVPSWLVQTQIATGALMQVMPNALPVAMDIYGVWAETLYLPLRLRLVIDRLAKELPGAVDRVLSTHDPRTHDTDDGPSSEPAESRASALVL